MHFPSIFLKKHKNPQTNQQNTVPQTIKNTSFYQNFLNYKKITNLEINDYKINEESNGRFAVFF